MQRNRMSVEKNEECLRMYMKEQNLIKEEVGELFDQISELAIAKKVLEKKESPLFVSVRSIITFTKRVDNGEEVNPKGLECHRLYHKASKELSEQLQTPIKSISATKIAEHAQTYSESSLFITSPDSFLKNIRMAKKERSRQRRVKTLALARKISSRK